MQFITAVTHNFEESKILVGAVTADTIDMARDENKGTSSKLWPNCCETHIKTSTEEELKSCF